MTMSNTYIAITLGPLIKTLSNARATRELWGASYLFSYIMLKLLVECKKIKDITIVSPFVPETIPEKGAGAGLFPDHCFLLAQNKQALNDVLVARKTVIEQLAVDISNHLKEPITAVDTFLKQYLKVYVLEQEITDANPLTTLNKVIDTLELQDTLVPIQKQNYIAELLNKVNKSFLTKEAFGRTQSFPTLIEISSQSLADKNSKKKYDGIIAKSLSIKKENEEDTTKEETDVVKQLKKEFEDLFKTYHKYICIIHADGDNVGSAICGLKTIEQIGVFSEELFNFGIEAVNLINNYKGVPTFAGGDDLLFIAPMMSGDDLADSEDLTKFKTGSTIFDLIDRLDTVFENMKERITDRLNIEIDTSDKPLRLSYGISVSHYKFPMGEAITKSRNLCFVDAKKTKNAIALQVLKHSGQYWDIVIQKDSEIYTVFKAMLSFQLEKDEKKDKEQKNSQSILQKSEDSLKVEQKMLQSVLHKLDESKAIFENIGRDKDRIATYLNNSFDEDVHKTPQIEKYFKDVVTLIFEALNEKPDSPIQTRLDKVYALLSTIHFLKRKDND